MAWKNRPNCIFRTVHWVPSSITEHPREVRPCRELSPAPSGGTSHPEAAPLSELLLQPRLTAGGNEKPKGPWEF